MLLPINIQATGIIANTKITFNTSDSTECDFLS